MGTMRPDKYDVLIAGALCSGRGSEVILQSRCSRKFLRIENDGKVHTTNIYQNLTISTDNGSHVKKDLRLIIFSKQANRYLCFKENKWTLVGLERIPEDGRHWCQFYEQAEDGHSTYVSVINKTRAIGFNKHGDQIRNKHKQNRLNCFMFFKCSEKDEECIKAAMEIRKNNSSDSNSNNTGQSNGNSNRTSYKNINSNNSNNNNNNNNGKKFNKKSQQSPNMQNGKNKKGGGGKRRGKGKRRNMNSNNGSINNNNNNSISNLNKLQIYEPLQPNLRHNNFPNKQTPSMKRQNKLNRPVRHSHHRNHHQQPFNAEDKIAQIYDNIKNN